MEENRVQKLALTSATNWFLQSCKSSQLRFFQLIVLEQLYINYAKNKPDFNLLSYGKSNSNWIID